MKNASIFALVALFFSLVVQAHEGHDKTPGAVSAPHGGIVKGTESIYIELVVDSNGIKLYPLTHEGSPIALNDVALKGSVSFPKKTKAQPISFSQSGDHFSSKVDSKGAHRYSLDLVVNYKGKQEKTSFQVEPQ